MHKRNVIFILFMLFSASASAETCKVCLSGTMLSSFPELKKTFEKYGYSVDKRSGDRPYCADPKNADYSLQFNWIPCNGSGSANCGFGVYNAASGKIVTEIRKGTTGVYEQLIEGHRPDQLVRNVLALFKPRQTDLSCKQTEKESAAVTTRKVKEVSNVQSAGSSDDSKDSEVKSITP